ncbi:small integral membrane protein 14 [Frieseomelitta varia]|uniref:small integral membrane protein 14 n=1 Tax=Frieseomelitta varia TaxID=561572 RepID=UPI001CB67990|nr:small integral membrane protein 14 [Frieseomelitta varia]XP_043512434.1 small integral membrane protein 14 [Frieseomelitta varia]XP_043512435.1 small integral membrane protein 14 [Frieseomelitta varia]XP_043512436.1 small integral membrane protein 14 [Frieseomelitta varia]
MADERSDLCECIWSHEFAMQRLLSILRQSQSYCTDNECFSISQLPGPRDDPLPSNFFMTILLVIAFAILMYAFRPNSLRSNSRQSSNDTVKDRDNERDSNNDPPAPPPTA